MASDEFGEKTEQATDHRRSDARQKGNVARSQDLNAAGLLLAAAMAISIFGLSLLNSLGKLIHASLATVTVTGLDSTQTVKRFRSLAEFVVTAAGPLILTLVAGVSGCAGTATATSMRVAAKPLCVGEIRGTLPLRHEYRSFLGIGDLKKVRYSFFPFQSI